MTNLPTIIIFYIANIYSYYPRNMAIYKELVWLIVSYLITFVVSTSLVVYVLHLPVFITGQQKMVTEYYYDNIVSSTFLDLFLVFVYLLFAQAVIYILNVNRMISRMVIVAFVTLCISGTFYILYKSKPLDKKSFFSRWFYAAGFSAVVYDIVLLTITYAVLMISLVKTKSSVQGWLK